MAVLSMKRLALFGLIKDLDPILESLQRLHSVEIIDDRSTFKEDSVFSYEDTGRQVDTFETNAAHASDSLKVLEKYSPQKYSFVQRQFKRENVLDKSQFQQWVKEYDNTLAVIDNILSLEKELKEIEAAIPSAESSLEEMRPWIKLDVPFNYEGTQDTRFFIGSMLKSSGETLDDNSLIETIEENTPGIVGVGIKNLASTENRVYIVVICHRRDAQNIKVTLEHLRFDFAPDSEMIPSKEFHLRENHLKELKGRINTIKAQLESLSEERDRIRFFIDYSQVCKDRTGVTSCLAISKHTFILNGWIAEKDIDDLNEALSDHKALHIELSDPAPGEKPPIRFEISGRSVPIGGVISFSEKIHSGGRREFTPFGIHTKYYKFEEVF